MARPSTIATTVTKRQNRITSKRLLRLFAAIRSRKVGCMARVREFSQDFKIGVWEGGSVSELDLWCLANFRGLRDIQLKELGGFETEHAADDIRGKALQGTVVLPNHIV